MKTTVKAIALLGIISISMATFAHAEPTYLQCKTTESNGNVVPFSVKLDEDSGKITQTYENGSSFNAEGFFSINTISYQTITRDSSFKTIDRFEIDRKNLNVVNVWTMESINPRYSGMIETQRIENKGSCEVVQIKDRKI